MASGPKKPKSVLIRMRVSPNLHAYLGILARDTILGTSENDVAQAVLTQRLGEMLDAKFHEKKIPK
jgi:hypothetical protein